MKKISSDSISDYLPPEDKALAGQIQAGRIAIISWLGLGRRPSGQVANRLRQQGFSDTVVTAVMASLRDDGYLDDVAIAKRLARQHQGRQAESRAALDLRMQRLGLTAEAISAALPDEAADLKSAVDLLGSRFGFRMEQLRQRQDAEANAADQKLEQDTRLLWQKAGRFLAGRGYSRLIINRALTEFLPGIDSDSLDQA